MAFRIGSHVVAGELSNKSRNSINGYLAFGEEEGVHINLTGNLAGELRGRHFRFEVKSPAALEDCPRENLKQLHQPQIGIVGDTSLRMVRIPTVPIEEFLEQGRLGLPFSEVVKPSLYLEWYSQNGRVVAEIGDVELTFDPQDDQPDPEPEPLPDQDVVGGGPEVMGFQRNEDGTIEEIPFGRPDDEEEDPYGLFDKGLEETLHEQNRPEGESDDPAPEELVGPENARRGPPELRPWDEVIPGIDPETKKMYEEWDEVTYGTKDEPVGELFEPAISLKPPAEVADEDEAEFWLRLVLAKLALHAISIDMCEHATALATYRWLVADILPQCRVHPRLPAIGWVQHYSTTDRCPKCQAEFDREWDEMHPEE